MVAAEVERDKHRRGRSPLIRDNEQQIDRGRGRRTECDADLIERRLAPEIVRSMPNDGAGDVRGRGRRLPVLVILEQSLDFRPAFLKPLFARRHGRAVEHRQRIGQLGARRELLDRGKVGDSQASERFTQEASGGEQESSDVNGCTGFGREACETRVHQPFFERAGSDAPT